MHYLPAFWSPCITKKPHFDLGQMIYAAVLRVFFSLSTQVSCHSSSVCLLVVCPHSRVDSGMVFTWAVLHILFSSDLKAYIHVFIKIEGKYSSDLTLTSLLIPTLTFSIYWEQGKNKSNFLWLVIENSHNPAESDCISRPQDPLTL